MSSDDRKVQIKRRGRWGAVPEWLLDADVGSNAIHLFAVMDAKWADRDDLDLWPSRSTIAAAMGCSKSTVDRAMRKLIDAGAVRVTRRRDAKNEWTSSLIEIFYTPCVTGGATSASPVVVPSVTGGEQTRIIEPEEEKPAPSATGSQDASQRMIDRPATERFDTSLPSYKLCAYFAAKWLEHTPDAKPNITKKWVDEADRLLRIDQRDKAEIKEIIDWMFTNHERPYYGNSCHAIPSFRKLYLKIRGEMWTAQKRTGGGAPQSRPRGVQQQPQGAPVQFGTDGKATEAYRVWEREQRAAMKADMIAEVGEAAIEQMRADGRLPAWWDDV